MTIEISEDTEHRLAAEARRRGISVDTLLQLFIDERALLAPQGQRRPALPVWHLGSAGAYHRRDLTPTKPE
jgi:hypothetical protein